DGLLLLHAFPLDARMWEPQLSAFSTVVPVVAPHLPGFGGSEPAGPVMSMAVAADRVLGELEGAGIDRAVMCGLSMGGYVSLELWRRAPERFAGVILANTRAGADSGEGAAKRRALAERLLNEGTGFLAQSPPPLLSDGAPEEVRTLVRHLIGDQPAASIAAASVGMAERPDSTPDLTGIDVPALVITSTGDTLIPPDVSSLMAEQIPRARLEVIEGAGHLSNLEAPEEFNRLLELHLERCGILG
ncbi:MAG TPA: alpha/beta fold hydrolase, partial [Actinomycetota bacterium]|nr:alpha/beta fold hydrolase [Actinomycetota bacterium]